MHQARFYSAALALFLIAQCWLFNLLAHDSHLLGVFPWLLGLVVVPLVILLAVRQRSHSSSGASASELRRFGWSVLWPACLAFACFFALLSAVAFGSGRLSLVPFSFAATLVSSLALGVGSTEVAVAIAARATRPTARGSAA